MRRWLFVLLAACNPPPVQQPTPVVADAAELVEEEAEEEPAGPAPAPKVDGELPHPEYAWWLGASERDAVVLFGSRQAKREYFAVVDVRTGCLTETYAKFDTIWRALNTTWFRDELKGKRKPDAIDLSTATLEDELAGMIGWLARFRITRLPGLVAWSGDGTRILFATTDWMFRSRDGGRTLLRVDGAPSYEPDIAPDGAWGAYRRCDNRSGRCQYRVALVPLDADRPPVSLGDGVKDVRFDAGGRVVYARATRGELCVDRVDVRSRRVSKLICTRTDVRSEDALFMSPNGRYGALEIVDKIDPPNSGLRLVSLDDGRVLYDARGTRAAAPPIDDRGRLAWPEGVPPGLRAHVADARGDRVVGDGDPLGFDASGRLVVKTAALAPGPPRRLGNPACGLIRVLAVP